jgi:hypothetical protein
MIAIEVLIIRIKHDAINAEVSGLTAPWARPDTTPSPVSYAARSLSAAEGRRFAERVRNSFERMHGGGHTR